MTDTKDPTLIEYENLIEQLMQENDDLKKRISELKEENDLLKHTDYLFKEPSPSTVEKEAKKPVKWTRKAKKKDKLESSEPFEEPELEVLSDLETPVPTISSSNKPIVKGYSRRQCPHCDNNRHMFIYEEIDKTNIILDYPRIYGKKYKCGKCGGFWRLDPLR